MINQKLVLEGIRKYGAVDLIKEHYADKLTHDEIDMMIKLLQKEGVIYQPKKGYYKVTPI